MLICPSATSECLTMSTCTQDSNRSVLRSSNEPLPLHRFAFFRGCNICLLTTSTQIARQTHAGQTTPRGPPQRPASVESYCTSVDMCVPCPFDPSLSCPSNLSLLCSALIKVCQSMVGTTSGCLIVLLNLKEFDQDKRKPN
jgi:hypothetical protein